MRGHSHYVTVGDMFRRRSHPGPTVTAVNALTRRWAETLPAENTVVCGPGLWLALAGLQHTAAGPAEAEIAAATGVPTADVARHAATVNAALTACAGTRTGAGVWVRKDVTLREGALDALPGVDVGVLSQEAVDTWASERTSGVVQGAGIRVATDTLLALLTAAVADGAWTQTFQVGSCDWLDGGHRWASLHRSTQDIHEATVLAPDGASGRASRVVCRTVGGFDVHLVAGSPTDGPGTVIALGLDALGGRVEAAPADEVPVGTTAGCLVVTESEWERRPVLGVTVPAFDIEAAHDLTAIPRVSGIASALDRTRGHFPRLAGQPLALSQAVQTLAASFTDTGFRAAAVTAMTAVAGAGRPQQRQPQRVVTVRHERPFAFLAVDRATGLVLFAGWVQTPTRPWGR